MSIIQVDYKDIIKLVKNDTTRKRFNTIIVFVNNLNTYLSLVTELEGVVEMIVKLSDPEYTSGKDTVPNLKRVLSVIDRNTDKNILIPTIGEYLRIGMFIESNSRCIRSIIDHQAHSTKRVWLPIFCAKDEFFKAVGTLDEEHYPDMMYEIDSEPSGFEVNVYSPNFVRINNCVDVDGIRQWLQLWDDKKVETALSYSTKYANKMSESEGYYKLSVVTDPFKYLITNLNPLNAVIKREYGTDDNWIFLNSYVLKDNDSIDVVLKRALNVINFDSFQFLRRWESATSNEKWAFWLWFKLGLFQHSDYLTYALSSAKSYDSIIKAIDCAIFTCVENPNFDNWANQRIVAMKALKLENSRNFWLELENVGSELKKLKLLSTNTVSEKSKIVEVVSDLLNEKTGLQEIKYLIEDKYPDLLIYLNDINYFDVDLTDYIRNYKFLKIKDTFSLEFSLKAEEINIFEYETRAQILNKIKTTTDAYYLWVDGMGIEWIDLLTSKVAGLSGKLGEPKVSICSAVLPTVTSVNMNCADRETVSEKINDLDSLSHIKDKGDCNYYSVIAKQFDLITEIAKKIVQVSKQHPDKDIVITSDHGMSRLAAKGFHELEGIKPQKNSEVYCLGRYCVFPEKSEIPSVSHTKKENNVLAFKTHNHFTSSGYAPGEIHGGATPEEILVPVIHYKRDHSLLFTGVDVKYTVDVFTIMKPDGNCDIKISTDKKADKVALEIQSRRIDARKVSDLKWVAAVPNLKVNQTYRFKVYINNRYSAKEESITVKTPGLQFDDDF